MIPLLLLLLLLPLLLTLTTSQTCPDILPTTSKIINGNPTPPTYQIALSSPPTPSIRRCTATRISKQWALTAAHCLVNTSWTARINAPNINSGTPIQIIQVVSHPSYLIPTDRRFDIAAIKLPLDTPFTPENRVLLNTSPNLPTPPAFVRVSGYGATDTSTTPTFGSLQHVDIPIVPFQKCRQLYQGTPNLGILADDKQLCAGYPTGGCDACSGDSGGPIVQFDSAGRSVQVALVSASRGCALPNFPGIGVRVDAYLPWLTSIGADFETGVPEQLFDNLPSGDVEDTPEPDNISPPPDNVSPPPGVGVGEGESVAPVPSNSPSPSAPPRRRPPGEEGVGKPVGPVQPDDDNFDPGDDGFDIGAGDGDDDSPAGGDGGGDDGVDEGDGVDEDDADDDAVGNDGGNDNGDGKDGDDKKDANDDGQKTEVGDSSGEQTEGGNVNVAIIAGSVVGGIVLIAVFVVGGVFVLKNRSVDGSVTRLEAGEE